MEFWDIWIFKSLIKGKSTNLYCLGVIGEVAGKEPDFSKICTTGAQSKGLPSLTLFNYLKYFCS